MVATDWQPVATDATNDNTFAWPWAPGMDDAIAIDLSAQLDTGESITDAASTLWRLKSTTEPADTNVSTTSLVGEPVVSDTVVSQRISDLEAGRVYRLVLMHGASGNRRAVTAVISVIEQGES